MLPQSASLARGAARALPIEQQPSVVFFEHTTPNERQMDNIMYLYEQPGPPDEQRRRMEVLVV